MPYRLHSSGVYDDSYILNESKQHFRCAAAAERPFSIDQSVHKFRIQTLWVSLKNRPLGTPR